MKKLHDYTNEILEIAQKNGKSGDIGKDMFLANVHNAGGGEGLPYYEGAAVDYLALKPQVVALEDSGPRWARDYKANYDAISGLWREGQRSEISALMEAAWAAGEAQEKSHPG